VPAAGANSTALTIPILPVVTRGQIQGIAAVQGVVHVDLGGKGFSAESAFAAQSLDIRHGPLDVLLGVGHMGAKAQAAGGSAAVPDRNQKERREVGANKAHSLRAGTRGSSNVFCSWASRFFRIPGRVACSALPLRLSSSHGSRDRSRS
jgi:hypothetical protein